MRKKLNKRSAAGGSPGGVLACVRPLQLARGGVGWNGCGRRGETDGGGNARRLGIDPAFDQKVMTALMSDDIIDSSTGKYVLYGSYGDLDKFRKLEGVTGVQLHHLNQQGVFGETIPYRDGVCMMVRGNAITEKRSEHNLLHTWTEGFFDNYRAGGKYEGELSTVGEYNIENAKSIGNAGFGNDLVEAFINAAVQEQFDYGFSMDELIPRIPGSMHLN